MESEKWTTEIFNDFIIYWQFKDNGWYESPTIVWEAHLIETPSKEPVRIPKNHFSYGTIQRNKSFYFVWHGREKENFLLEKVVKKSYELLERFQYYKSSYK